MSCPDYSIQRIQGPHRQSLAYYLQKPEIFCLAQSLPAPDRQLRWIDGYNSIEIIKSAHCEKMSSYYSSFLIPFEKK
ncbi:hypothetical protein ES708_18559 [subsurface metagenome]